MFELEVFRLCFLVALVFRPLQASYCCFFGWLLLLDSMRRLGVGIMYYYNHNEPINLYIDVQFPKGLS